MNVRLALGMTPHRKVLLASIMALSALVGLVYTFAPGLRGAGRNAEPFRHDAYVWQTRWTDAVVRAVRESAFRFDAFAVLAAEADGRRMAVRNVAVDWKSLSETRKPVIAVLRINSGLASHLAAEFDATVARVVAWETDILQTAKSQGVTPDALQVDYDCPTGHLSDYAALMRRMREVFPESRLSMTALPTWLGEPRFKSLLQHVDDYVLQAHFLDRPDHVDDPVSLCDPARALHAVEQAAKLGAPFVVALPTYGYRLMFDASGRFVALAAEGAPEPSHAVVVREVHANPAEMADLVRRLKADRPAECLGIAWFRLPVEGDRMNWSPLTLEAVMRGEAPRTEYAATVKNPKPQLFEVWITNSGHTTLPTVVHVDAIVAHGHVIATDVLGPYRATPDSPDGYCIVGPLPRPGESAMAAWFRLENRGEGEASLSVVKRESAP